MADHTIFETGNPGRLALPGFLTVFMVAVFSLPAIMLIPTTWSMLPQYPFLMPLIWLGAFFPLFVLFVLKRLMARYALRVLANGGVEVVLPFRTHRLARGELAAIRQRRSLGGRGGLQRPWIDFVSPDQRVLVTLAGGVFTDDQLGGFVEALNRVAPQVVYA